MTQVPVKDITPPHGSKDNESFDLYAKREHIHVKFYKGFFKNFRLISSTLMLVLFYGVSWLQWDGRQAVLFDLPNRHFYIFGFTFWPQDFMLLSWLLIILAFTLFLVTAFAGRLWCGYACPQFVWTWLFIWAERITEGDRNKRLKLDRTPWTTDKLLRKTAKHLLWILFALATAIAFVGYFSPIRELIPNITVLHLGPWEAWWLFFFTVATYGNAGWLREQVCIYMCPYARFQSVMFDPDTLIISYDTNRGEPRGKRKKGVDFSQQGLGECIDCGNCVHVCPVGIDIRNGLQYECVACGACVDACNSIMDRMEYPRGLVRYTTENQLEGKKTHVLRPRLIGYFIALLVMITAFSYTLLHRVPLQVDILRDRGQLYTMATNGNIQNVYRLKILNKSEQPHEYSISASGFDGLNQVSNTTVSVNSGELGEFPVRLEARPDDLEQTNYPISFTVQAVDDQSIKAVEDTRFIGPTPQH